MPSIIRLLDEITINKIAAGEVIENPSSVVKELIENSLDAGSTDITIEIQAGGRHLIRVSDNGSGMGKDDLLLCLERHATSKLKNIDDLTWISSLGFRGEAIPSIASISKFSILSSEGNKGHLLKVEGGKILSCNEASCQKGTSIEVKELFFNLPVRKKFLKSPTTDENDIIKMTLLIAISHPEVKFQLIINQKPYLLFHPEEPIKRIESALGIPFKKDLIPVNRIRGDLKITGYLGKPQSARPNRSQQYLFVNGRPIQAPFISWAIKEAYSTHLASLRYPLFVLWLTLPPELVDMNVHPQKKEARFRDEEEIKRLLFLATQETLAYSATPFHETLSARSFVSQQQEPALHRPSFHSFAEVPSSPSISPSEHEIAPQTLPQTLPWESPDNKREENPLTPATTFQIQISDKAFAVPPSSYSKVHSTQQDSAPEFKDDFDLDPKPSATPLSYDLVSIVPGFLLCKLEGKEGIVLIDQQRAHSRIIFEQLEKGNVKPLEQVALLIPHTFELTRPDALLLKQHFDKFRAIGFEIREFGPQGFAIEAYPIHYKQEMLETIVSLFLEELSSTRASQNEQTRIKKQLADKASHLSIPTTKRLSKEEALSLLNALISCHNPWETPQGKPTLIHLDREILARHFV